MNTHLLAQALTLPGGSQVQGPEKFNFASGKLGDVLNGAVPLIFAAAGIGLLVVIISAGFSLLTSAGDSKKMDHGKSQLTNGIIGFVIVFIAYWIVQIVGYMFGITEIKSIFQ